MNTPLSRTRPFSALAAGALALAVLLPAYGQPGQGGGGAAPSSSAPSSGAPSSPSQGGAGNQNLNPGTDLLSQLTIDLTLTSTQVSEVTALLATQQTADQTAQTAFTSGFEAILTSAQLAIYEAKDGPGPGGGAGVCMALAGTSSTAIANEVAQLTSLLTLTTAQQTETTTLLTTLQTALAAAQSAFTTALEADLTSTQLALYQAEVDSGGEAPFGAGLAFVADYYAYLSDLLTLTSAQQSELLPLLETLQTSLTTAANTFNTAFEADLTSSQLAIYEAGPLVGTGGPAGDNVSATVAQLTSELTLTTAQQAEATTLLTALASAGSSADSTFDTALEALLTSAQLKIYQTSLTGR